MVSNLTVVVGLFVFVFKTSMVCTLFVLYIDMCLFYIYHNVTRVQQCTVCISKGAIVGQLCGLQVNVKIIITKLFYEKLHHLTKKHVLYLKCKIEFSQIK